MPDPETGKVNSWSESAHQIAAAARTQWCRIQSNRAINAYEKVVALRGLPEPEWPNLSPTRIIELAFSSQHIDSASHQILLALRGEI
jgi:hypothetical protein